MTDLHDAAAHVAPDVIPHLIGGHPAWQRICRVDDLEPGWGEAALIAGAQVALFRLAGDAVYAVQHADPVTGAHVIARGITGSRTVGDTVRPTVASPLHKQVYDLSTGDCLTETGHRLRTYPTRLVDGWLELAA